MLKKLLFVLLVSASIATSASAACNKACQKIYAAEKAAVWKTKKKYSLNGNQYYAAVAPNQKYVLVKPVKKSTPLSVNILEAIATAASGCKNRTLKVYG